MDISKADLIKMMRKCRRDPFFFSKHVLGGPQPWDKQREIWQRLRRDAV